MDQRTVRQSNLELLRIVAMMGIVASHYLFFVPSVEEETALSFMINLQSIWGKIGINIFMLISGYFMCTKDFSWKRYLKIFCELVFYHVIIMIIMMACARIPLDAVAALDFVYPWRRVGIHYFEATFLVFYLLTPFIKILTDNMTQKQHGLLTGLLLAVFVGYNTMPTFFIEMDAILWFGILYLIASYIRLYGCPWRNNDALFWGGVNLVSIVLTMVIMAIKSHYGWKHLPANAGEANSIYAVAISVSAFMFFKNLKIPYSALINTIAATTFGVLLIHSGSATMREWYMIDVFNIPNIYNHTFMEGIGLFVLYVVSVFTVSSMIDMVRIRYVEQWYLKWVYRLFKLDK